VEWLMSMTVEHQPEEFDNIYNSVFLFLISSPDLLKLPSNKVKILLFSDQNMKFNV